MVNKKGDRENGRTGVYPATKCLKIKGQFGKPVSKFRNKLCALSHMIVYDWGKYILFTTM